MFYHKGSRLILPAWPEALLAGEMRKLGVSPEGIEIMKKKRALCMKIKDVSPEAALIIKQEALARACEVAAHKDVLTKRIEESDILLWGTIAQLEALCLKIASQPFGLSDIADDFKTMMKNINVSSWTVKAGEHTLTLGKEPVIMGVLNVTPDSFSDGGRYVKKEEAVARGVQMVEEGARIIDVGGESSRPFAEPVSVVTEKKRVLPVIKELAGEVDVPVSIDSYHPEVVAEAISAGATIINDITGLRSEEMIELVADSGLPVVLMHMKGMPRNMQENPTYDDVMEEISLFFEEQMTKALEGGVSERQIILDPGIGFGKIASHNLTILNRLHEFRGLGRPLLVGSSRKSFIGHILGTGANERLEGSLASVVVAQLRGAAVFRAHDVEETTRALAVAEAILKSG